MRSKLNLSRRRILKLTASTVGLGFLASTLPRLACADDLPHVAEADPTATALGYREDAGKVDAAKYPAHKTGQTCSNCKFFAGTDKTPWAGCQLFPAKAVAAKGWCSAYNAKT